MDRGPNPYRVARERAGLSITEVARRTGLSRVSVYDLEGDRGNPTISTVRKLADLYGVRAGDLLTEPIPA